MAVQSVVFLPFRHREIDLNDTLMLCRQHRQHRASSSLALALALVPTRLDAVAQHDSNAVDSAAIRAPFPTATLILHFTSVAYLLMLPAQ
jgi:hypothetical protein